MKYISILVVFITMSLVSFSQAVVCDLGFSNNSFKNASGGSIDANNIAINQIGRIQVAVANFSPTPAPAGHFQIIIGLGSALVLNPTFDLSTAPLSTYFTWSYDISGAQPYIIGTSKIDLPANFAQFAYFEFKGNNSSTSTVSFNFLIANPPSTTTPLSDQNSANNSASNTYTVSSVILPVNFAGFSASVRDCNVNLEWNVKNEQSLNHYEIEVSKDGTSFTKNTEVMARNQEKYNTTVLLTDALKSPVLYFRIKSVDKDGHSMYSAIAKIKGQCEQSKKLAVSVYPNPAANTNFVTVSATTGSFNGKYKVQLIDKAGKTYQTKDIELNGVSQFKYAFGNIAAGSYTIVVKGDEEMNSAVVEFTKL